MEPGPTHAALVVPTPGQMRVEQVATKFPRDGEILVSSLQVGICGSDLDMMRGARPMATRILGHEGVAQVVAVGADIHQFAVGQYVTFVPKNPTDPSNILGDTIEGLNQQYLLIPQSALERGMVVPLAAGIPLVCGPLIEPFATVIYGQRLVQQVGTPESMVVVGTGPIGLLNALCARSEGCSQIFLVGTSQARLDWAVRCGIVEDSYALLNSPTLADMLLERTGQGGVDAACLCTPRSATRAVLTQALQYVHEDGCIDLAAGTDSPDTIPELPGVHLNGIRQANLCGLGHEITRCIALGGKRLWLTGQTGASEMYLREAMKFLCDDPAYYARVISHIVPYQAAPHVFQQLLAPKQQYLAGAPYAKVIIDFTSESQKISLFHPDQMSLPSILSTENV